MRLPQGHVEDVGGARAVHRDEDRGGMSQLYLLSEREFGEILHEIYIHM